MKRIILLFFLCAYAFFSAGAIDWPVEDRYLTATFGESRSDHFHTGIDIGREQEVSPVERGELVFINDSRMYGTIPSGMGNFIILEHAGKIRSVYAHLAPDSIPVNRERFQKRDTLGLIGESGYSLGKHLHFELIDRKLDRLVNPLLVLPPYRDKQAPVIESLRFNELEPVSHGGRVITETTELPVSVVTYDPSADADYFLPTAPYSIEVRVNGERSLLLNFDMIQSEAGEVTMGSEAGRKTFHELYGGDWEYKLGRIELDDNVNEVTVLVSDAAGNTTEAEVTVSVR